MSDSTYGKINSGITLSTSESVRRDATNTTFEAFVPVAGIVFTEGSIPFADADGALAENNSNLNWNNSINQLTVGSPVNPIFQYPEIMANFYGNFGDAMTPDFACIDIQNISSYGSTDVIVSNDLDDGTADTGTYGDLGIAGSTYNPNSADRIDQPGDVYLNSSPGANNLNIFTQKPGTKIRFATAGDSFDQLRMDIADDKMTIYANKDTEQAPALTDPNWTQAGGWGFGTSPNRLILSSNAGPNTISPTVSLAPTIGVTYRIVITASATSGAISYTFGGATGTAITATTITDFITATTTDNLVITGAASATATITAVSVRALISNTGDLFIEGNLKFGGNIQNTNGANVLDADPAGQATFALFPITPSSTPSTDYEVANKLYVDSNIAGAIPLPNSQLATTANITLVGEQTIDGVMTSASTVLVKDQTLQKDNGVYVSGAGAWSRASYYNSTAEVKIGTFTFITAGSTNVSKTFSQYLFNPATDTLGVDPIAFTQTGVAPTYTGSNGIQLIGSDFSAKLSSTGAVTLTGIGTDELTVAVDNSSIERATNALRVKALGITSAMLAGTIDATKIGTGTVSSTVFGYLAGVTSSIQTQIDAKGVGTVTSVSGTSNRITSTGGATPVLDISASYVGQSSITTLGTITTGVWTGTDIAFANIAQVGANTVLTNPTTGTADISTTALSASQLLGRGSTGNVAAITLGAGLTMTGTSLSVSVTGLPWTEVTGTSQSMAINNGYILNNAALVTATIPSTAAVGSTVRVSGSGAGGWKVAQNASQIINFGVQATTTGTSGYLASTNRYDAVELLCIVANTTWVVLSSLGNITIN